MSTYNFTRPSAATVTDYMGCVRTCQVDEARFHGARRVHNLVQISEPDDPNTYPTAWSKVNGAVIFSKDIADSSYLLDMSANVDKVMLVIKAATDSPYILEGQKFRGTIEIKPVPGYEGNGSIKIATRADNPYSGVVSGVITLSNGVWTVCGSPLLTLPGDGASQLGISISSVNGGPTQVYIRFPAVYDMTDEYDGISAGDPYPHEYVSSGMGADYGTNVDNVKYFPYEQRNYITNGKLTYDRGPNIPNIGYFNELPQTNYVMEEDLRDQVKTGDIQVIFDGRTIAGRKAYKIGGSTDAGNYVRTINNAGQVLTGPNFSITCFAASDTHNLLYIGLTNSDLGQLNWIQLNLDTDSVTNSTELSLTWGTPVFEVVPGGKKITIPITNMTSGVHKSSVRPNSSDPTKFIYVSCIQYEEVEASSYISTVGGPVMRAEDDLFYTEVNVNADFTIATDTTPTMDGYNYTNGFRYMGSGDGGDTLRSYSGTEASPLTSWNMQYTGGGAVFNYDRRIVLTGVRGKLLAAGANTGPTTQNGVIYFDGELKDTDDVVTGQWSHTPSDTYRVAKYLTYGSNAIVHSMQIYNERLDEDTLQWLSIPGNI